MFTGNIILVILTWQTIFSWVIRISKYTGMLFCLLFFSWYTNTYMKHFVSVMNTLWNRKDNHVEVCYVINCKALFICYFESSSHCNFNFLALLRNNIILWHSVTVLKNELFHFFLLTLAYLTVAYHSLFHSLDL